MCASTPRCTRTYRLHSSMSHFVPLAHWVLDWPRAQLHHYTFSPLLAVMLLVTLRYMYMYMIVIFSILSMKHSSRRHSANLTSVHVVLSMLLRQSLNTRLHVQVHQLVHVRRKLVHQQTYNQAIDSNIFEGTVQNDVRLFNIWLLVCWDHSLDMTYMYV